MYNIISLIRVHVRTYTQKLISFLFISTFSFIFILIPSHYNKYYSFPVKLANDYPLKSKWLLIKILSENKAVLIKVWDLEVNFQICNLFFKNHNAEEFCSASTENYRTVDGRLKRKNDLHTNASFIKRSLHLRHKT